MEKPRNSRYERQGRNDEAMRLKVQQMYASPLARPVSRTNSNELNSSRRSHARQYGERVSITTEFNETDPSVFRKRSENINNIDVKRTVVFNSRTAGFRPSEISRAGEETTASGRQEGEINKISGLKGNELNNRKGKYYDRDLIRNGSDLKDYIGQNDRNSDSRCFDDRRRRPSHERARSLDGQIQSYGDNSQEINRKSKTGINSEDSKSFIRFNSGLRKTFGQFEGQKTWRSEQQQNINEQNIPDENNSSQPKAEIMDNDKRNKIRVQEKIVTIRRKSVDLLQENDPSSVIPQRKLSQVSQDLMKSKEELINRSKQCGLMLEQFKKREEEKRENKPTERNIPGKLPAKNSSQSSFEDKTESEYSYDGENRFSQIDRNSVTDLSTSSQSPRIPKRKSSYIDSWLQSQQNRISTLVSAIKEDPDEDDVKEVAGKEDMQTRDRASSVPPESSLFLSWGRSDDSSFDGDDPTRISHTRTSSGDEIMGVARNSPRLVLSSRSGSRESPVDSPRLYNRAHQSQSYSAADELRNVARQSMNMRQRRPVSSQSFDSTTRNVLDSRQTKDGRYVKIETNIDKKSPNSQLKLKKETTFDAEVTTNIVPADTKTSSSPRTSLSPRTTISPRSDVSPRQSVSPKPSSSPRAMATKKSSLPRQQEIGNQDTASLVTSNDSHSPTGTTPPFSNGRIFQDRHANMEGNRYHPVAVVKPLQHVKSQSFDGTYSDKDMGHHIGQMNIADNGKMAASTDLDDFIGHQHLFTELAPPRQTIESYNVQLERAKGSANENASFSPRDYDINKAPSQRSFGDATLSNSAEATEANFSSRDYHEKPVDVEEDFEDVSATSERGVDVGDVGQENAPASSPNFIMQDFQWYSAQSKNTYEKPGSLPRDSSLPQDSTQGKLERLGRFKRGSKLLESKYSSFSKSLENLSKIGKDYIKSKKKNLEKSPREKPENAEKHGKGKKGKGNPEKTQVVGDLELNEEFARKMERRSRRFSMDASKVRISADETEKRPKSVFIEKRHETDVSIGTRPKIETNFDDKVETRPWMEASRNDVTRTAKHGVQNERFRDNEEINLDLGRNSSYAMTNTKDHPIENRKRITENPRIAQEDKIDLRITDDFEKTSTFIDTSAYITRENKDNNIREHSSLNNTGIQETNSENVIPNRGSNDKEAEDSGGFIEDDDDDDEEQKEMVQIARKISTLRSSQYKKKREKLDNATSNVTTSETKTSDEMTTENVTSRFTSDNMTSDNMTSDNVTSDDVTSAEDRKSSDVTRRSTNSVERTLEDHKETTAENNENGAVKRISTSLSRVMTDLRELREQDMTLASQLLGLGKSIKHFKKQKKEMENFYAMLDEDDDDDSSEVSDSSDDEY